MYSLKAVSLGVVVCFMFIICHSAAWAKQPERVTISAETINVSVDGMTGVVTEKAPGRLQYGVKMRVSRQQPGNRCTRVPYLRVTLGDDPHIPDALAVKNIGSNKKGLCNFTSDFTVQPFTHDELVGQCSSRTGMSGILTKSGQVTFLKSNPVIGGTRYVPAETICRDEQECSSRGGTRDENGELPCTAWTTVRKCTTIPGHNENCDNRVCTDTIKEISGKQNPHHDVQFNANIECLTTGRLGPVRIDRSGPGRLEIGPEACNIKGWWKLSTGISGYAGEWNFADAGSRRSQGKYSSKGPASRRNGSLIYGNGSGNATIYGDKTFSWTLNNNITCTGRINDSCTTIDGSCRSSGMGARKYTFRLEKSTGPAELGTPQSPVGRPTSPNTTVKPITAPKLPSTNFPPKPGIPKW